MSSAIGGFMSGRDWVTHIFRKRPESTAKCTKIFSTEHMLWEEQRPRSDLGFEFIAHKIKLISQFIQNELKTKNFAITANSNNEQETRLTTGKV